MAGAVEIKIAKEQLEKTLRRIRSSMFTVSKRGLGDWAAQTLALVVARNLSRPGLMVRTGELNRGWRHKEKGEDFGSLQTELYTHVIYAAVHEYGKTITPKNARMLAIPLKGTPATDAQGNPLYSSPLRQNLPPGNWTIWRSKRGALLLGQREGENLQPWFLLRSRVKIPPRLRFRETVRERVIQLRNLLAERYGKVVGSE